MKNDNVIKETSHYFIIGIYFIFYLGLFFAYVFFSVSVETCFFNMVMAPIVLTIIFKARLNSFPNLLIEETGIKTTKGLMINWTEMEISKISSLKYYEEIFRIKDKNEYEIILTINLENRKKFVRLIKKYCPANHFFYELAEIYAEKHRY